MFVTTQKTEINTTLSTNIFILKGITFEQYITDTSEYDITVCDILHQSFLPEILPFTVKQESFPIKNISFVKQFLHCRKRLPWCDICVEDYTMKLEAVVFSEPLALFYNVCGVTSQKTVVWHIITEFNVQVLPSRVNIPASTTVPAIWSVGNM